MNDRLKQILARHLESGGNLISLLQDTQEVFGYIPEEAVYRLSDMLDIPASRFYGIITFYSQFHLRPRGRNIITVCRGTACHVKGSACITEGLRRELELADGEDTTSDGLYTLEEVACIGACSFSPVVLINGRVFGKTTLEEVIREMRKPENLNA
jgi:NADH:ubiquinone oxidoreductase subunit E